MKAHVFIRNKLFGKTKCVRRYVYRFDIISLSILSTIYIMKRNCYSIVVMVQISIILLLAYLITRTVYKYVLVALDASKYLNRIKSTNTKENEHSKKFKYLKTKSYDDYINPWRDDK